VAGVALDLRTDPCDLSAGEEGKGAKDARSEERVSTDVMVNMESPAFGRVSAFGHEFDVGYKNDLEIRFGLTKDNPVLTGFVFEGFFGKINRVAGTLEAEHLKYKKNGWLYLKMEYSLNCMKMERKF
jgi:hypothetical protein